MLERDLLLESLSRIGLLRVFDLLRLSILDLALPPLFAYRGFSWYNLGATEAYRDFAVERERCLIQYHASSRKKTVAHKFLSRLSKTLHTGHSRAKKNHHIVSFVIENFWALTRITVAIISMRPFQYIKHFRSVD